MLKRLSFLFVILILLSTLAEAFHHHDDGDDHDDCPICVAIHHQSDTNYNFSFREVQRPITEAPYTRTALDAQTSIFFSPANNRAPPA